MITVGPLKLIILACTPDIATKHLNHDVKEDRAHYGNPPSSFAHKRFTSWELLHLYTRADDLELSAVDFWRILSLA